MKLVKRENFTHNWKFGFFNGTKVKTAWWETMIKESLIAHEIIHTKTWTVLSFFHLKWNLKYYLKFQLYIFCWRSSYSKDYVKYEFNFSICSTASLLAAVKKVKLCICIFRCIYQDWTMVSTNIAKGTTDPGVDCFDQ